MYSITGKQNKSNEEVYYAISQITLVFFWETNTKIRVNKPKQTPPISFPSLRWGEKQDKGEQEVDSSITSPVWAYRMTNTEVAKQFRDHLPLSHIPTQLTRLYIKLYLTESECRRAFILEKFRFFSSAVSWLCQVNFECRPPLSLSGYETRERSGFKWGKHLGLWKTHS